MQHTGDSLKWYKTVGTITEELYERKNHPAAILVANIKTQAQKHVNSQEVVRCIWECLNITSGQIKMFFKQSWGGGGFCRETYLKSRN